MMAVVKIVSEKWAALSLVSHVEMDRKVDERGITASITASLLIAGPSYANQTSHDAVSQQDCTFLGELSGSYRCLQEVWLQVEIRLAQGQLACRSGAPHARDVRACETHQISKKHMVSDVAEELSRLIC